VRTDIAVLITPCVPSSHALLKQPDVLIVRHWSILPPKDRSKPETVHQPHDLRRLPQAAARSGNTAIIERLRDGARRPPGKRRYDLAQGFGMRVGECLVALGKLGIAELLATRLRGRERFLRTL